MKKFISVLLTGCMVFAFAACDKKDSTKKDTESSRESRVEETEEIIVESSTEPTGEVPTQLGAIDSSTFRTVMGNHNCSVGSGDAKHGEKTVLLASTSSYMTIFEYHLFNSESDASAFFEESQTTASNVASGSNVQITDSRIQWTTEFNYIVVVYDGDLVIVANTMAGNSELASEMEGILSELGY